MKKYSQLKAMSAMFKASFIAQLKSPMALLFGFLFPLFFILIFGTSNSGSISFTIALDKNCDTSNMLLMALKKSGSIKIAEYTDESKKTDDLKKGRITSILNIQLNDTGKSPSYKILLQSSKATVDRMPLLQFIIEGIITKIDKGMHPESPTYAAVSLTEPIGDRVYKRIDFILPGQLGFSLLSAGLFGLAFLFFNLRETLVLKRLNATPLRKPFIILGEALARISFQFIILSVIIIAGVYLFDFTLINGWLTYIEMMVICFVGLFVFMGFGFFISGFSKNINTIPALTNIIGFPQFMLSGTFFPYDVLPKFLQPISKALPLTHVNDALRKISFEGLHLSDCVVQFGYLGLWALVIYAIAIKVFRWE